MSGSNEKHSPLAQFEITPIYDLNFLGYDISLTNSGLFMFLALSLY